FAFSGTTRTSPCVFKQTSRLRRLPARKRCIQTPRNGTPTSAKSPPVANPSQKNRGACCVQRPGSRIPTNAWPYSNCWSAWPTAVPPTSKASSPALLRTRPEVVPAQARNKLPLHVRPETPLQLDAPHRGDTKYLLPPRLDADSREESATAVPNWLAPDSPA